MGLCGLAGVVPVTGYKQVDLPALYMQVGLHGGYDLVSEKKWWRNIGAPLFYMLFPASTHVNISTLLACQILVIPITV